MDYRSIIALSYENQQSAKKEVKKKLDGSSSGSQKNKGPSEAAVKQFLKRKQKEEIQWFNKIKVDKPPPPPSKKSSEKSNKSENDSSSVKKKANAMQQRAEASDKIPHNKISTVDKVDHLKQNIKKKTKPPSSSMDNGNVKIEKKTPKMASEQTPDRKMDTSSNNQKKSTCVPPLSNYAQILKMASKNAEKPPKFLADPDRAVLKDTIDHKPKSSLKSAKETVENKLDSRKRKLDKTNVHEEMNPAVPLKKKLVHPKAVEKPVASLANKYHDVEKFDKKEIPRDISASKKLITSAKAATQVSAPKRGGIAAQLSNRPSSAREDYNGNVPKSGKHRLTPDSEEARSRDGLGKSQKGAGQMKTQLNSMKKSNMTPSNGFNSGVKTKPAEDTKLSRVKNVKNEKSGDVVPSKTVKNMKPTTAGMSITMEDDDSNFVHISKKSCITAPQPTNSQTAVRKGIGAQNRMATQSAVSQPSRKGIAAQNGARGIAAQNGKTGRGIAAQYGGGFGIKSTPYRPGMESDEDEDDYDDDDDFIDDSEMVTENQYQSCVQEIHRSLRFDPNKYESVKPWEDLRSMEANYKDIEKEEKRSARLGMKEDLDDIKAEEERLKKKKKKK